MSAARRIDDAVVDVGEVCKMLSTAVKARQSPPILGRSDERSAPPPPTTNPWPHIQDFDDVPYTIHPCVPWKGSDSQLTEPLEAISAVPFLISLAKV